MGEESTERSAFFLRCTRLRTCMLSLLLLASAPALRGRTLAEATRGASPCAVSIPALDLPGCIRTALEKHPALRAARAAVARRRAGLDQARSEGNPNLSLSADFSQYRKAHVLHSQAGLSPAMQQTLAEADAFARLFGRGSSSYVGSGVADLGADLQSYLAGAAAGAGYPGDIAGYFDSLVQGATASLDASGGDIGLHGERVGRARLGLDLPLLTFGRLEGLRQEAGARVRAAEADLQHVTLGIAHAIVQRYLDAYLAWNLRATHEEELERLTALAELVSGRRDVKGYELQDRLYRIQGAMSRAREALEKDRGALMQAEAALREVIGTPEQEGQGFRFLPPDFRVIHPSPEAAVALAFAKRRDLERERLHLRALHGQLRHARALGRPNLHLSGELSTFRDNEDFPNPDPRTDYRVMIGGSMPLFDGGRSRSKSREAQARIRGQEARVREVENAIRTDVKRNLLALRETESRAEQAWRGLETARRHADMLGRAFEASRCPFKRTVEGQEALAKARENFHRILDRRDRSITALSRAMGLNTLLQEARSEAERTDLR